MKQLRAIESILRGVLYVSPIAANTENETFLQLSQSLLDCLDVLKAQLAEAAAGDYRAKARLCCKLVETMQLALEMMSNEPSLAVERVEWLKFTLRLLAWSEGGRIGNPDSTDYIGSLTGLKLKALSSTGPVTTQLILSDFFRCIAPLIFAISRRRMKPSAALAIYLTLQVVSLSLLQDRTEFKDRLKLLAVDVLVKRPVFDVTLKRPVAVVSDVWDRIPLLRELNYLKYVLSSAERFYYYSEGVRGPLN